MDKSRLQKNIRSKLGKSSKQQPELTAASSGSKAKATKASSAKVSSKATNNKKSSSAVQASKRPVQKTNVRSELQKKIEKDIARKKQEIFEKINPNIGSSEQEENLQPEASIKAEIPKKTVKVKAQKQKVVKVAKKRAPLKPFKHYVPILSWYSLALIIVLFDQMTKAFASSELIGSSPVVLTSWLQFDLVHNPGAAFSLFADAGGLQRPFLVFVSLAVSIFIAIWIYRLPKTMKLLPLALTFVLGGAVGNLIDRALDGYVVDFISVHYQTLFFPSFNIADAAISCGAFMLFIDMFFGIKEKKEERVETAIPETNKADDKPKESVITAEELIRKADAKKAASAS